MVDPERRDPLAVAMSWVSVVTSFSIEVVLPTLGGIWLDGRWHTELLFTLIGLVLGFSLGLAHLLHAVQPKGGRRS